jgi:putative nucleotidyltransferase with HDIG domain
VPELPSSFKALSLLTAALSTVAIVAAASLVHPAVSTSAMISACAVLAALAVMAESLAVEFAGKMTVTAANLPILLAIMFLGPTAAMLVAAVAGVWGFWRERSLFIVLFNVGNYMLAAALASIVYSVLQSAWGFETVGVSAALLVAGVAAAATYEAANLGFATVAASLMYRRPFDVYWRSEFPPFLRSLAVLTGMGLMTAALYAQAGLIWVVLLFAPLFASQYMFRLLAREKAHLAKQKVLSDQYLEMNIGLAAAMVVLLDSKDEYTAQHSAAVAMYCRDIAGALRLPEDEADALHLAGLLHDLGKVGVPDAVLRKTTTLSDADWACVHEHPEKGAEVLSHLANYQDVADIVRYHHERLDGSGYPSGACGDDIPELSKILAVCDSYHAMTSDRPYHAARSSFEALQELRLIAGRKLEGAYIEVLARVLRDKDLAYRDGSSTDFMGEYERGRINLRLRGQALADVSGLTGAREDPAAG